MALTNIQTKKAQLEVLEKVMGSLDDMEKDFTSKFQCVGKKDEQARVWRTGELLWEDEEKTIPKYEDRYEWVPYPEDKIPEENKVKLAFLEDLRAKLDALV